MTSPHTNIDEILQAVATKAYNDKKADSLLPSIILGKELTPAQAKTQLEALLSAAKIEELESLSFTVVEPCEPECDEVRHALHEGSWNAHLKIEERIKELESYRESQ